MTALDPAPESDKNPLSHLRENSWKLTGQAFIVADLFYGAAGIVAGNPVMAAAALSGLVTNGILAKWGGQSPTDDASTPLLEKLQKPQEHPVDSATALNLLRDAAFMAGGFAAAAQNGDIAQGISLASSGLISAASNSLVLGRGPLADLGEKISPSSQNQPEECPLPNRWARLQEKLGTALQHSTNFSALLSYPGLIAMASAGLTADSMAERVLLVSGVAADGIGIALRSLAPKTEPRAETSTKPCTAPIPIPVAKP